MFKKTIAVLLLFSIVLSSCGKKDKSNDFVRATPVVSPESSASAPVKSSTSAPAPVASPESSVPVASPESPASAPESPAPVASPESPAPVKSSTPAPAPAPAPASTSTTHSRFMYYWQYEMYNFHGFAITTKGVVLTLCTLFGAYAVFKMPIFRWMRKKRLTHYGAFFVGEDSYDDSISHWLHRHCRSVFASLSSSSSSSSSYEEQIIPIYAPTKGPRRSPQELARDLGFWRSMKAPSSLQPLSSLLIPSLFPPTVGEDQ